MIQKKTFSSTLFDVINYTVLIILALVCFYPLYHVAVASLSNGNDLLAHSGILLKPINFTFAGYQSVFKNPMILTGYRNTLFIVIVGTFLNIIMTSLAAYALSRRSLEYRKILTLLIVFTMYFSGGLIPSYLVIKGIKLTDTLWALIVPGLISTTNFLIMRTSFEAIPESLSESARIDGANDIHILFRIVLPLSKPVIAVMVIYYGVSHWNAWFNAMIYLRQRELFPLQLILREILMQDSTGGMTSGNILEMNSLAETLKYATIMVATVPILCVYPFVQKYFAKGVMIGAVKG